MCITLNKIARTIKAAPSKLRRPRFVGFIGTRNRTRIAVDSNEPTISVTQIFLKICNWICKVETRECFR